MDIQITLPQLKSKTFREIPANAFYTRKGHVFVKVNAFSSYCFTCREFKPACANHPDSILPDRELFPIGTRIEIVVP